MKESLNVNNNVEQQKQFRQMIQKHSQNDFVVILNKEKSFLLKEEQAKKIEYFRHIIQQQGFKICFIDEPLNEKAFLKIIKSIENNNLQFGSSHEFFVLYETSKFLKTQEICRKIILKIIQSFQQYGIFSAFLFSQKFSITEIAQMCIQELLHLDFQQINIQKADLMESSLETFAKIIRIHQHCKLQKYTQGLSDENIKNIIAEYEKYHNIKLDQQNLLSFFSKEFNQIQLYINSYKQKIKFLWQSFKTPSYDFAELSKSFNFDDMEQQNNNQRNTQCLQHNTIPLLNEIYQQMSQQMKNSINQQKQTSIGQNQDKMKEIKIDFHFDFDFPSTQFFIKNQNNNNKENQQDLTILTNQTSQVNNNSPTDFMFLEYLGGKKSMKFPPANQI